MDEKMEKWNSAIDIMTEILQQPFSEFRQAVRDERCCAELEEVRKRLIQETKRMRL